MLVVALDQPATGCVVVRDREQQRCPFGERKLSLHQTFPESGVADDPGPVMILQRSGYDFRSRCRPPIHQYHNRITLPVRLGFRPENLLLLGAPPMRNYGLPISQIMSR